MRDLLTILAGLVIAVLVAALAVPPFDARAYVARHFTKVSAQSQLMVGEWIAGAEALGWEPAALRALTGLWEAS